MIDVGVSSTRAIARFFGLVRRAPPVADAAHRSAEPDAGDDAHATPAQTSAGAKTRSGAEALSDAKTRSDVAPAAAGAGAPADDGTPPPRDLKPRALREPTTAARSEQADPAASHAAPGRIDVAAIITKALRTAGLMR
ncbi:hypothetical protein [Chenggangzhangella methanolivorans]|uniref:Uncharacterized protein n=2 Tax=Chenggangzhangella methanolivorans TaxID=1437009 RepID=A0A9E6UNL9_9HYPH|nr:hypothetical protein [Chenggangzhangella methanolivorans]QZN98684.1 hypothetical protein K6K41_16920 [Chenggangzhangella methanolivorans]